MAMSKIAILESRIVALEAKVAQLNPLPANGANGAMGDEWVEKIYGAFADDPDYDKAMELGRQYRESLRPKPRVRKAAKAARTSKR
jgi:hypothetical protein